MTKSLLVDPNEKRKAGVSTFNDIPLNTYQKKVKDEKGSFTKEEFLNIYRDMLIISEFESMLNSIKISGQYEGMASWAIQPVCMLTGQAAGTAAGLCVKEHKKPREISVKKLQDTLRANGVFLG